MFTQRCLFLSSEHNSFHFSWRFHTHTHSNMHPHIHAHTKWTCRICRSVYWLLYLWRRCAFWKRCFCSPLFYGDFTFSISSKQHFFLRSFFSPLSILFTECSDANSSNKSWRVALFKVSHSKRSVQTLHNTFSLFPTALSKCTNAFHFIWKRCSPFSLFISLARALPTLLLYNLWISFSTFVQTISHHTFLFFCCVLRKTVLYSSECNALK